MVKMFRPCTCTVQIFTKFILEILGLHGNGMGCHGDVCQSPFNLCLPGTCYSACREILQCTGLAAQAGAKTVKRKKFRQTEG